MKTVPEILEDKHVKGHRANIFGKSTFLIEKNETKYMAISSKGGAYEYVSVMVLGEKRIPTWYELCDIKDIFFKDEEECFQEFPKKSESMNQQGYCMYIRRKKEGSI